MATYYAQRKTVLNGQAQTPSNMYGTARAMRRQFHLYCANALGGEEFVNDIDTIEWGTLEQGAEERVCFIKDIQPEPEPGPEEAEEE